MLCLNCEILRYQFNNLSPIELSVKVNMKKIICYGDSNTFGFNPKDGSRFDENTRWTSVLQNNIGTEYKVINEGMCNRTGFVNNPDGFIFSGAKHFAEFVSKLKNTDILILWIGTNDLMFQYNINIETVENGLKNLIELAKTKAKRVIIIPSVILDKNILKGYFSDRFDETSIKKSNEIVAVYKKLAKIYYCEYFDVNDFVRAYDIDGLHYDEASHKIIADKLSTIISL